MRLVIEPTVKAQFAGSVLVEIAERFLYDTAFPMKKGHIHEVPENRESGFQAISEKEL